MLKLVIQGERDIEGGSVVDQEEFFKEMEDIETYIKITYNATRTDISVTDANGWEIIELN